MSRLKYEDIKTIHSTLEEFDNELKLKTGCSLKELANRAVTVEKHRTGNNLEGKVLVGVVPVTAGKGCIRGFSEALSSIARHLGFRALITASTDTAGFAEAINAGCTVVLMADDNMFIAYNRTTGTFVDNNMATAFGFAAALEYMIGGLAKKSILILGAGPIGKLSMVKVLERGGLVGLLDLNQKKAERAAHEIRTAGIFEAAIQIESNLKSALCRYDYIIDATPAGNIIDETDVSVKTVIVSPGVPHGLTKRAVRIMDKRFLHDNLRIGVATMLSQAVSEVVKEDL